MIPTKVEKAETVHQVLCWLEDQMDNIHPAFELALKRAYELGRQDESERCRGYRQ